MKHLLVLDFLSIQPVLLIEGNRRNQTPIGTVLSLLTMIISSVVFGLFLDPLINKKNPSVVYSTYQEKNGKINLEKTQFNFAVSLWDSKGQVIPENEKVYNVKALFVYNLFQKIKWHLYFGSRKKVFRNEKV